MISHMSILFMLFFFKSKLCWLRKEMQHFWIAKKSKIHTLLYSYITLFSGCDDNLSLRVGPHFVLLVYLILRNKQLECTLSCWFPCTFNTLDQFYSRKVLIVVSLRFSGVTFLFGISIYVYMTCTHDYKNMYTWRNKSKFESFGATLVPPPPPHPPKKEQTVIIQMCRFVLHSHLHLFSMPQTVCTSWLCSSLGNFNNSLG